MSQSLKNLIRRKLDALLDEVIGSDDPGFGGDQVDLLEKRFFEIRQDFEEALSTHIKP